MLLPCDLPREACGHCYVAYRYRVLGQLNREKTHVITLHLGNGCSAAAIRGGYPVDTSMGMTPLEGLAMGTRSGDIDPAIVNLVATKEGLSTHEVDALMNTQSGLLGISGRLTICACYRKSARSTRTAGHAWRSTSFATARERYIGAFLACMGGADAVVFTGGIGENSANVRSRICENLEWAGLRLDEKKNQQMVGQEGQISTDDSSLHAYVIPTDEDLVIASDTVRCILGEPHPS